MRAIRQIFSKKTAKTALGLTIGAGLGFGFYHLAQDIQVAIQQRPAFEKVQQFTPTRIEAPTQAQKQQEPASAEPEPQKEEKVEAPIQNKEEQKEEKSQKIERRVFRELKQIKEFSIGAVPHAEQRIIIVADLPYNKTFEDKVVAQVNALASRFPDLKVYRKDLTDEKTIEHFGTNFKAKIKDQTLFLLKNPYEKGLSNIDFDIYLQFPQLMETYLKDVNPCGKDEVQEVKKQITNLNPHESCLLYLYDSGQAEQKIKERMLASKYIEMEMGVNNLSGIKLAVVDKSAAIEAGLVDIDTARTNSLHLFRPHNIYTPHDPNFYLSQEGKSLPFHRLADIALFSKGSKDIMLTHYLAQLQTFDAIANPAPYLLTLRVDRNRINEEEYNKLMRIFGNLKAKEVFPNVAFALKLKQVPYTGEKVLKNKQWQVTLSNVEELDREAMMHEIQTEEQKNTLGYQEETYLKSSHEYLYPHAVISSTLLQDFIKKSIKGQEPKYFKSEESHPLAPISPLVGSQFKQAVLDDDKDHLVYEYSGYCPTCKKISPIIGSFAKVVQEKGLGLNNLAFHKMDANKNRVKGQLSSPFIPNVYYFKKEWKQHGPLRFPIESLGTQGLASLYIFCAITNQLGTIDWKDLNKTIDNGQQFREELKQWV